MLTQNFRKNRYYISSLDYEDFYKPRVINIVKEMNIEGRKVLKCEVSDLIDGNKYNASQININEVYFIGRFDKESFSKIKKYPYHAHLLINRKLNEIKSIDDLYNIAWVMIYDNFDDAKKHKIK